jgi:hypothetical protein
MLGVVTAVLTASLALGAGTAHAEDPPVAGCGNGLSLTFSPSLEGLLADLEQGPVNGDGWVCVNSAGLENNNGIFDGIIVIDNVVPLRAS